MTTYDNAFMSIAVGLTITIVSMLFMYISNQLQNMEPLCYYNPFVKWQAYKKITNVDVTFNDIVGCDEIKDDLKMILNELKNGSKKVRSKGFIFYGPPGTGKTLMAKAVANEISVPFFSMGGKYVFNSMSIVKTIKGIIYRNSPCVIILDEGYEFTQHATHDFLELMDGLEKMKNVIFIVTLTDTEFASIPSTITRSGRIDRIIKFNYPNRDEIKILLQKNIHIDPSDIDMLCKQLPYNITQSDIIKLSEDLAIIKPKNIYEYITKNISRIIGTKETNNVIYDDMYEERICYHEIGHFMISLMLKSSPKPNNVSILSQGQFSGLTSLNRSDMIFTLEDLLAISCTVFAGGFFEKYYMGSYSTGHLHDMEKIDKLVNAIIDSKLLSLEMTDMMDEISIDDNIMYHTNVISIESRYRNRIKDWILTYVKSMMYDMIEQNTDVIQKVKDELINKKSLTIKDVNMIIGTDLTNKYSINLQHFLEAIQHMMLDENEYYNDYESTPITIDELHQKQYKQNEEKTREKEQKIKSIKYI